MKIEKQKLPQIIAQFYDSQIVPQASGMQKFLANMVGVVVVDRASQIVNNQNLQSIGEMVGVLDNQGYVELDKVKELLTKTFEKNNGEVEFMGYIFDIKDVEALYEIASRG